MWRSLFLCLFLLFAVFPVVGAYPNLEDGQVIYFSFDEADENMVINAANADINGTLEGGATLVAGYTEMGVALNAEAGEGEPGGDFVRVANNPEVNVGGQFSIAVWAMGSSFGDYRTLMSNTDSSGYALTVENGLPAAWIHVQGAYLQLSGKTQLKADEWYHLALTFDGKDAIIYLNGKEEAKASKEGDVTVSSSDFFIGAEPSGQGIDSSYPAWHGILDEFYFYNRALTQDEIGLLIGRAMMVEPSGKIAVIWGLMKIY